VSVVHRFYVVKLEYLRLLTHIAKFLPGAIAVSALCAFVYPSVKELTGESLFSEILSVFSVIGLSAAAYFGVGHFLKLPEALKVTRRFTKR
ncbi:MAG: hypothetical protein AAF202_05125, partial [Pseudomonadota bacterium]